MLATGRYVNKDNADCVRDPATQAQLRTITSATWKPWAITCWTIIAGLSRPRE